MKRTALANICRSRSLRGVVLFLALLLFSGCGYSLKGQVNSLPEEIKSVALLTFENKTDDADIELRLAAAIAEEFSKSKLLQIEPEETSHAILRGVVLSLSDRPVSFTSSDTATDYRLEMKAEATLKRQDDEVVWKGKNLREGQDYKAEPGDVELTRNRREEAEELLVRKMAELIHDSLVEGF